LREAGGTVHNPVSGAGARWTVGQLMLHLAQTELAFGMRFRMALTTPSYVVQPV